MNSNTHFASGFAQTLALINPQFSICEVALLDRPQAAPHSAYREAIESYLARNPGRVYSRTQLLDQVFGIDFEGYDRTIDAHVKNIRQKMQESAPGQSTPLVTVRGVGYKLQPDEDAKSQAQT